MEACCDLIIAAFSCASSSSAARSTSSGWMVSRSGLGRFVAGVVAAAFRAAQHLEAGAEWPVAAGIGGSVDAHHRPAQRAGQVQRARIAGHDQRNPAGERDQLVQRAISGVAAPPVCFDDRIRQRLFAGSGVDQHANPDR